LRIVDFDLGGRVMAIKELTSKSEHLIDFGEKEFQRKNELEFQIQNASSELFEIEMELMSAEQLDEEGNPSGDVASLQSRRIFQQAILNAKRREHQEIQRIIERIDREKKEVINEIDQYQDSGRTKLDSLGKLQEMRFGDNTKEWVLDIVNRLNASESAKVKLLKSMGINATQNSIQANQNVGTNTTHHSISSEDEQIDDGDMVLAKTRNGWNTIRSKPDYERRYSDLKEEQRLSFKSFQESFNRISQSELERSEKSRKLERLRQEFLEYSIESEKEKRKLLSKIAKENELDFEPEIISDISGQTIGKGVNTLKQFTIDELRYYDRLISIEPRISQDIKENAKDLGGKLEGFEYRIKKPESVIKKITHDSMGRPLTQTNKRSIKIDKLNDLLRYTQTYDNERLAVATLDSIELLQDKGYRLERIIDTFPDKDSAYKGINAVFSDPGGNRFELQYHTPQSYNLKNGELHQLYEQSRYMNRESKEFNELLKKQIKLSENVKIPDNIDLIRNYRRGQS